VPTHGPLVRTPYYFLGPRPYREAECAAYIRREHARGRDLCDILGDPYLRRFARGTVDTVLERPELIRALCEDVAAGVRSARPAPPPGHPRVE
jgi:hypothetical protein